MVRFFIISCLLSVAIVHAAEPLPCSMTPMAKGKLRAECKEDVICTPQIGAKTACFKYMPDGTITRDKSNPRDNYEGPNKELRPGGEARQK